MADRKLLPYRDARLVIVSSVVAILMTGLYEAIKTTLMGDISQLLIIAIAMFAAATFMLLIFRVFRKEETTDISTRESNTG